MGGDGCTRCPRVINFQSARSQMISFHPVSTVIRFAICGVFLSRSPIRFSLAHKPNGAKRMQIITAAAARAFYILHLSVPISLRELEIWGRSIWAESEKCTPTPCCKSFIKFLHDTDALPGWKMGFLIERVCWHSWAVLINLFFCCSPATCFHAWGILN